MLDPVILNRMLRNAGAGPTIIRRDLPAIQAAAERYYLKVCPVLRNRHCPGVETLLERLVRRGVLLGLVTGNLTRIGWRKLERAGLRRYFRFGAFGEMAATRAGLVKLALREARALGWNPRAALASVIGDAPADVIAARANRIRSIAVMTGITPVEELTAENPDVLLPNLRHLRLSMVERE
jgi:phosphoglycolate phosphatase-like HAD superfamily hydrolase